MSDSALLTDGAITGAQARREAVTVSQEARADSITASQEVRADNAGVYYEDLETVDSSHGVRASQVETVFIPAFTVERPTDQSSTAHETYNGQSYREPNLSSTPQADDQDNQLDDEVEGNFM